MATKHERSRLGILTDKEEAFARHYAWLGEQQAAAAQAGYASPAQAGWDNMRKPAIRKRIDEYRRESLDELTTLAICRLRGILTDDTAAKRDVIAASKVVLNERRLEAGALTDPSSLNLEGLTPDELDKVVKYATEELDRAERKLAALARPVDPVEVIEATEVEDDQVLNVFD